MRSPPTSVTRRASATHWTGAWFPRWRVPCVPTIRFRTADMSRGVRATLAATWRSSSEPSPCEHPCQLLLLSQGLGEVWLSVGRYAQIHLTGHCHHRAQCLGVRSFLRGSGGLLWASLRRLARWTDRPDGVDAGPSPGFAG